jgi:hypothetical protein
MTETAIRLLSRNRAGYVLLIEGGRIDHAHHAGNAYRALSDTKAMDDAVAAALRLTKASDTLIITTADHSHTLTISGYAPRGNPILGTVNDTAGKPMMAKDGKSYTTLGYANGPWRGGGWNGTPLTHLRRIRITPTICSRHWSPCPLKRMAGRMWWPVPLDRGQPLCVARSSSTRSIISCATHCSARRRSKADLAA